MKQILAWTGGVLILLLLALLGGGWLWFGTFLRAAGSIEELEEGLRGRSCPYQVSGASMYLVTRFFPKPMEGPGRMTRDGHDLHSFARALSCFARAGRIISEQDPVAMDPFSSLEDWQLTFVRLL